MKKVWFVLLMFVIPLQAALAAAETYGSHGSNGAFTLEAVAHTHADHDHEQHTATDLADPNAGMPCEGDHHHCHGHTVSVLPSFNSLQFPPKAFAQDFEPSSGYQSILSNRIDRPKWA